MAKHKEKKGTCAICGTRAVVTRDHVPPQAIFLKPFPSNMITVPTCGPCNNGAKLDDEYFRACIATGGDPGTKHAELWKEKVVNSTLARSPALRTAILRDRQRLIEFHRTTPLQTFDGRILPEEAVDRALWFDADRINRVLVRIVRGLYYHHYRAVMPQSTHFIVSQAPLDETRLTHVLLNRKGLIGNHEEFLYWFDPSGQRMAWALFFYIHHIFTLETMPSKSGNEEVSIRELM